jgi:hypothetical protein
MAGQRQDGSEPVKPGVPPRRFFGTREGGMDQGYWLDPIRSADLLRAVLEALVGDARVAIEGDARALEDLGLFALANGVREPSPPFSREYKPDSAVVVVPLENAGQARLISEMLSSHGAIRAGIETIQVERRGSVEFQAADGFHRQCVSVGTGVSEELLRDMTRRGIIEGFHTLSEARKHFGLDDPA